MSAPDKIIVAVIAAIAAMFAWGFFSLDRRTQPESKSVCWRADAYRLVIGPDVYLVPFSAKPKPSYGTLKYLAWIGTDPDTKDRYYCRRKEDPYIRVTALEAELPLRINADHPRA